MHFLLGLVMTLGTVSAAPFELISERALEDHELTLEKRGACPGYLPPGQFEFPHYITQISATQPNRAFGPQYRGRITPKDISTIFSFDIPKDRANANCTLEFLFPTQDQLKTSYYKYSGPGTFYFMGYLPGSCPGPHTTYSHPPHANGLPPSPPINMKPGFAYTINVGPCATAAGNCVSGGRPNSPSFRRRKLGY
ncbi:ubiquitin 3 binding protein But2 C-terminal domain-containing protein [Annulohypoxylon moriforme]|nr:ubiquitin 3 binding protein But2 C-terminal domain-containing protein [Annulohypoxylon moriforme]